MSNDDSELPSKHSLCLSASMQGKVQSPGTFRLRPETQSLRVEPETNMNKGILGRLDEFVQGDDVTFEEVNRVTKPLVGVIEGSSNHSKVVGVDSCRWSPEKDFWRWSFILDQL